MHAPAVAADLYIILQSSPLSDMIDGRMLVLVLRLVFTEVGSLRDLHENLHGKACTDLLKGLSFRFGFG